MWTAQGPVRLKLQGTREQKGVQLSVPVTHRLRKRQIKEKKRSREKIRKSAGATHTVFLSISTAVLSESIHSYVWSALISWLSPVSHLLQSQHAPAVWREKKHRSPEASGFSEWHSLEGLSMLKVAQKANEWNDEVDRVYKRHPGRRTNGTFEKNCEQKTSLSFESQREDLIEGRRRADEEVGQRMQRRRLGAGYSIPASSRSWQTGPWSGEESWHKV